MSALGTASSGRAIFDNNGQMVVRSPQERVIGRSVVVTRTVTEASMEPVKTVATSPKSPATCSAARHNRRFPIRWRRAQAVRPHAWTATATDLLTPFGKATLTDRYLMPGESFQDMFAARFLRLCRRRSARPAAV